MNDTKKPQLILVPIEPLTERYTESWYRNYPLLFNRAGFNVTVVDGRALQDEVKVGTFLDINSTVHYKMVQLQKIAKMFNDGQVLNGTVFFFGDTEFWGLESVRLMAQMNQIKVYITSFLHAASYTKEDAFSVAEPYQRYTEVGWIAASDLVFVGSSYHKQQVYNLRLGPVGEYALADRIKVTKNPLFLEDYPTIKTSSFKNKQKKFVLTNRFDVEKRPLETLNLFKRLKASFPEWEFVVTTSRSTLKSNDPSYVAIARAYEADGVITIKDGLTKAQYHQELSEAFCMVTHSIEENYGYCLAEALLHECHVVARDCCSHPDFICSDHRFQDNDEAFEICSKMIVDFNKGFYVKPELVDIKGGPRIVEAILDLIET